MKAYTNFVLAVATAVILSACGGSNTGSAPVTVTVTPTPSTPATLTVSGYVDVPARSGATRPVNPTLVEGGACGVDENGYDDMTPGTQVILADATGQTVGTGELLESKLRNGTDKAGAFTGLKCRFPFIILNVPRSSSFYTFKINNHEAPQYSVDQLDGETVALTLGD